MLLIEKCETSEQIRDILLQLIYHAKGQEQIDWLKDILKTFLKGTLENNDEEIVWKTIKEKEYNNMDEE